MVNEQIVKDKSSKQRYNTVQDKDLEGRSLLPLVDEACEWAKRASRFVGFDLEF